MFKDKLKELREKEGLSQQGLADKLFVSRSAIAKWENGNGIPSDVNLEAICKFFDIKEEWLLDREELKVTLKNIDNKVTNLNIVLFSISCFILIICLVIGGNYWLHRIPIVFTIIYLIFKFLVKDSKPNRIICLVSFVISLIISLINWIATSVAEPSSFFRVFETTINSVNINALNLSLSQVSSILNIILLLGINTVYLIVNKKDKKIIASSIVISIWQIIDIVGLIISFIFLVLTFSYLSNLRSSYSSFKFYFKISEQLGIFTIIPISIYIGTIFLSIVDMIVDAKIISDKKNNLIKILLLTFLVLSCITIFISWLIASHLASTYPVRHCYFCE